MDIVDMLVLIGYACILIFMFGIIAVVIDFIRMIISIFEHFRTKKKLEQDKIMNILKKQ